MLTKKKRPIAARKLRDFELRSKCRKSKIYIKLKTMQQIEIINNNILVPPPPPPPPKYDLLVGLL